MRNASIIHFNKLALIVLIVSSLLFTSCASLLSEIVVQILIGTIATRTYLDDDEEGPKTTPRKKTSLSLTEQFYLHADRTDHYLAGVRRIRNFDNSEQSYPRTYRYIFENEFWFEILRSESKNAREFQDIFRNLAGRTPTIKSLQKELYTPDLTKPFDYDDFIRFNDDLEPTVSEVRVFDNNLLTYYEARSKMLHVVLLPTFAYDRLGSILATFQEEKRIKIKRKTI